MHHHHRDNRDLLQLPSSHGHIAYLLEDEEADVVPLPDFVQLDDVWVVLWPEQSGVSNCEKGGGMSRGVTYEDFEDVDLVDERGVVLDFLFLDCLNGEQFFGLAVLGKVDDAEAAIGKLLLEVVLLLDVALVRVAEVKGVVCLRLGAHRARRTGTARARGLHYVQIN